MQSVGQQAQIRLMTWLQAEAGLSNPRLGPLLAGGNANVTQLIESDQGRYVLRHPPVVTISDKAAAGISREFTALSALYGAAPVPKPIAWCDDKTIIGQPFSIISWLDGVSLTTDLPQDYRAHMGDADAVSALGKAMVEGLAAVHASNCRDRLPPQFGKPELFVERQIKRWLDVRAADAVRDLPLLSEVAQWLLEHRPACENASIIHCDFHLDNCLVDRHQPRLVGILDWEMATLGDPLIDLGLCLFFWQRDPQTPLGFAHVQGLSNRRDVISADALADIWSAHSGYDHKNLTYYKIFSAWRLAAIVEGAYVAYRRGLDDRAYTRGLEQDVPNLLQAAAHLIAGEAR